MQPLKIKVISISRWYIGAIALAACVIFGSVWIIKNSTKDLMVVEVRNHSGSSCGDVAVDGFGKDGQIGTLAKEQSTLLHLDLADLKSMMRLRFNDRATGNFATADNLGDEKFFTVTIQDKTVSVDKRRISTQERIVALLN